MEHLLGQMFGIGTILHLDDENKWVFPLFPESKICSSSQTASCFNVQIFALKQEFGSLGNALISNVKIILTDPRNNELNNVL